MAMTERVVSAIKENARQIDACDYGEVVVKMQDGAVVLVEVTSKRRPRHVYSGGWSGPGDYKMDCACGFKAIGAKREAVEAEFDAHLTRQT